MKVEEATKVKEKLDDVLLAVEEYGKQSEQFSKARKDLFSVLGVMNNTNSSLGQLLTACDQYLKKASEVIDGEYFVKIQGVINEINTTATNLEKCNENTSAESVKLIEESKKQLTALADTLSQNIQTSIDKVRGTADDLQAYSKQASDNAKQLIESSSNEILSLVDKLKDTCETLMSESEELKKNDATIIKTQDRIIAEIEKAQGYIVTEIQKNNDICKKIIGDIEKKHENIVNELQNNSVLCNNIIAEINKFEINCENDKTEIINTVKKAIDNGILELKKYEDANITSIKEVIFEKNNQTNKLIRKLFWAGGIVAIIIFVLLLKSEIIRFIRFIL